MTLSGTTDRTDEWVAEVVARAEAQSAERLTRPLRREGLLRPSARCPVCGGFMSDRATCFVDGREVHRSCVGDGR